ncbi:MAG: hypothetical protein ABW124_20325 [Candidatus Thiodiazotropha sp. 6PLUC9]
MTNSTVKYLLLMVMLVTTNMTLAAYNDAKYQTKSEMCEKLCGEDSNLFPSDNSKYEGRRDVVNNNKQSVFSFVFLTWGYYIAYYIIAIALAILIFRNAKGRETLALNLKPIWWGILVFIDPVLGILAYWVMNILDVQGIIERSSKIRA